MRRKNRRGHPLRLRGDENASARAAFGKEAVKIPSTVTEPMSLGRKSEGRRKNQIGSNDLGIGYRQAGPIRREGNFPSPETVTHSSLFDGGNGETPERIVPAPAKGCGTQIGLTADRPKNADRSRFHLFEQAFKHLYETRVHLPGPRLANRPTTLPPKSFLFYLSHWETSLIRYSCSILCDAQILRIWSNLGFFCRCSAHC